MKIVKKNYKIRVYLNDIPNKDELKILNTYGSFRICEKYGQEKKRLLQYTPSSVTPSIGVEMECPIKEWFVV